MRNVGTPGSSAAGTPATVSDDDVAARRHANRSGALWMLLAALAFTVMGALIKHMSASLPVAVIVFFRMLIGLALLAPWLLIRGRAARLLTRRPGLHLLRSVCGALSLLCFVYAVGALPFATAVALAYTTPLWMIANSVLFLGERVGAARSGATFVGFFAVLVILRPDVGLHPAMLVALGSAFSGSLALMLVKKLSAYDSPLTILFYFLLFGTFLSALPAGLHWQTPGGSQLAILLLIGAVGAAGLYASARAYRVARASVVTPVDFIRLPLAGVIGLVVFGESPELPVLVGTAIILAALFVIVRA